MTRLASFQLPKAGLPVLPILLALEFVLLSVGCGLAIVLGPFRSGDGGSAILTGMALVAAMAIQNAVHCAHYVTAPPTTLMTGTSTQIMIDLADLARGLPTEARGEIQARLGRMAASVAAFALGCAASAALGVWCFTVPPILALAALTPSLRATITP